MQWRAELLTVLAIAAAAVGLVLLAAAVRSGKRARTAEFYGMRRAAGRRFGQLLLFALSGFGVAILAWIMHAPASSQPVAASTALPEPSVEIATAQPAAQPVARLPAATLIAPSIVLRTPTENPIPTAAPTAAPTQPAQIATPAGDARRLSLQAIAPALDDKGAPLLPGTRFSARTRTVHIIFNFWDVPPQAVLRTVWNFSGAVAYADALVLNKPGNGTASVSWTPAGGFEPGLYEVRFVLGNAPQFVANFEIR